MFIESLRMTAHVKQKHLQQWYSRSHNCFTHQRVAVPRSQVCSDDSSASRPTVFRVLRIHDHPVASFCPFKSTSKLATLGFPPGCPALCACKCHVQFLQGWTEVRQTRAFSRMTSLMSVRALRPSPCSARLASQAVRVRQIAGIEKLLHLAPETVEAARRSCLPSTAMRPQPKT